MFICNNRRCYIPHVTIDAPHMSRSEERIGRLNRQNWSSSDHTWLKIKHGCRTGAFNANRPRIVGSKIIHVDGVSPATLFVRPYTLVYIYSAMSYAYGYAFARKFQLNFICGIAIESPPNRPPAINSHFRVSFGLVYK